RLVDFALLLTISQHRLTDDRRVSFISYGEAPVPTSQNGRFRFSFFIHQGKELGEMIMEWLVTLLQGIGYVFLHPLFYIGFFTMLIIGIARVKREREDFHTKVYDFIDETVISLVPGIVTGMVISLFAIGLGIVVSVEFLMLVTAIYLLFIASTQIRWVSPSYVIPVVVLGMFLFTLAPSTVSVPVIGQLSFEFSESHIVYAVILMAFLLIGEGFLIRTNGHKNTSPKYLKSKRGMLIGGHESKRLWFVPVFLLLPNGMVPSVDFWPVIALGEQGTFSIILVPFLVGFHQLIRSSMPVPFIQKFGTRVILLGVVISLLTAGAYFYPPIALVAAAAALLGREWIWRRQKHQDERKMSYFTPQPSGVMVLGVIPRSPAAKLQLRVGEVIVKVNGQKVNDQIQFYDALQRKSAFCKLEVRDQDGEIRFAQTALYDGQHHQLGVLLLKAEYELQNSVV
ncbi:PDZ domain-containing protein, partial [Alkalihalobacterium elongatum]|uniref:PDZ domain-containing protein n=1 Tax=Alkalihalobacterium elongatum TaxID=2675466 RepID=UPI001C1FE0B9